MADFVPAFQFLLPHEGTAFVDDPVDPGGATKYGISRRQYPERDIPHLTIAEAASIYLRDYWTPSPFCGIRNQQVANKTFDMCVNMGSHQAFLLLQRAVNDCGQAVVVDGRFGSVTLRAVNACDPALLLEALRAKAVDYYTQLAADRPSSSKFLNGWLARARA